MKKRGSSEKVVRLSFDSNNVARDLFGAEDRHLRSLEGALGIDIQVRGTDLRLVGKHSGVEAAELILNRLYTFLKKGYPILGSDLERAVDMLSRDPHLDIEGIVSNTIFLPTRRRVIMPRSPAQKQYIDLIRTNDIVFSIGPAGTGKTYLAVAMAVVALLRKEFQRIILTRPAVEAGEKLGFLPGDLQEKVNPYLRPLYDALYDMLEADRVQEMIDEDIIEIAPIAFMRGRTLHGAFVILDEAQNCNERQMKMCLTRLGVDAKMVITGDITQIDLPEQVPSGLLEARRILHGEPGIAFHEFTEADVVRHALVQSIVRAYQREEGRRGSSLP